MSPAGINADSIVGIAVHVYVPTTTTIHNGF